MSAFKNSKDCFLPDTSVEDENGFYIFFANISINSTNNSGSTDASRCNFCQLDIINILWAFQTRVKQISIGNFLANGKEKIVKVNKSVKKIYETN